MSSPSEHVVCFMQQSLGKEGIASLCSAENWSNSYHTLFLPNTAAGVSATMVRVEPGALSMVAAFRQIQLRNLCSNLSATQGWLYFVVKKHAQCWRVLFSGCLVLLVEACVFT